MTTSKPPAASARRAAQADFDRVATSVRTQLAAATERPAVRSRHVGALLAFSRTQHLSPSLMRVSFEDAGTRQWAAAVINRGGIHVGRVDGGGDALLIERPQDVLASYGLRGERWVFGLGTDAALGISRGAVHGAGSLNRDGLSVTCPNAAMMLTLYAVMGRLGIEAKLPRGWRGVTVSSGDVPAALDALGVGGVADMYQRLITDAERAA